MSLVTTREAAERLGVGTTTIKRWSDEGLLACVKTPGGHRRYRLADVLAMHQTTEGTPPITLQERLATLSRDSLDALPHGVIQVADDGSVLQYNATESRFSGLTEKEVLGKHFFGEVAPCTNNSMVYGRFLEGTQRGELDVRLFYTFSYRLELINVILRLYRDHRTATNWVIIETGNQIATLIR
jgi:photoactive yellow protein